MSEALFDLGARLRAKETGRPQPRTAWTLRDPLPTRLAVAKAGKGTFEVAGTRTQGAVTVDASRLLAEIGPYADLGVAVTLIVPDRATIAAMHEVARANTKKADEKAALLIDFLQERSEHPSSQATIVAPDACAQRWVLGTHPSAEKHLATWLQWLGIPDRGVRSLLDVLDALADGTLHPHVLGERVDQRYSYEKAKTRPDDRAWHVTLKGVNEHGVDWRRRDTPRQAVVGYRSRSSSTNLQKRRLLDDPLWSVRATYAGRVLNVTKVEGAEFGWLLRTQATICRFKADATVHLTHSSMEGGACSKDALQARIQKVLVDDDGYVVLHVAATQKADEFADVVPYVTDSDPLVVRPLPEVPQRDEGMTQMMSQNIKNRPETFHGKRIQREVPLSVIVAAANRPDHATDA